MKYGCIFQIYVKGSYRTSSRSHLRDMCERLSCGRVQLSARALSECLENPSNRWRDRRILAECCDCTMSLGASRSVRGPHDLLIVEFCSTVKSVQTFAEGWRPTFYQVQSWVPLSGPWFYMTMTISPLFEFSHHMSQADCHVAALSQTIFAPNLDIRKRVAWPSYNGMIASFSRKND